MISVRDGQNQILAQISGPTPPELLAVTRARERVLADDLRAPFDVTPTGKSAVDGYAVASGDVPASGPTIFAQTRRKESCTRANTAKSISAATERIQKPAGRAEIMTRIISP